MSYSKKPGTDWLVLHIVINGPTFIILLSCDDDQENFAVISLE